MPPVSRPRSITPVEGPLDAQVRPPGSKSLTNRALVCAALAAGSGESLLQGVLEADDTAAMAAGLQAALGVEVTRLPGSDDVRVRPGAGQAERAEGAAPAETAGSGAGPGAGAGRLVTIDARLSGTTARFLLPLLALRPGPVRLDGGPPLRRRPMGDGITALRELGAEVDEAGEAGHLPVVVRGPARPPECALAIEVAGDASSQFLSGLLMSGPAWPAGLELAIRGSLVSRPYVDMTVAVMRAFGAAVDVGGNRWSVAPGGYRPTTYAVEPDASAASYFFGAAAVCGGRVTVEGLGHGSLQGDLAFVDVLEQMGCRVTRTATATAVERAGRLRGVDVDLSDLSDTAQTLAAVAVFATGPSRVRGIGFIRAKETDRVGNVVRELRRCGIEAEEEPDGFVVHPGQPQPATVETYHDHRMAMSFALLGLRAPGIRIADPDCVAKTFPTFWRALELLG